MTSVCEDSSCPWTSYLSEAIDKCMLNLLSLLSATFGLTSNTNDIVIFDDETSLRFREFFDELVTFLSFDDFQLQLLKIFLLTFVSSVALIFVAWHIYGSRITEQFMKTSKNALPLLIAIHRLNNISLDQLSSSRNTRNSVLPNMADKIKSFFQKKKTNAKFTKAGKGYKLTDSTSTTFNPTKSKDPAKRAEPTEEARTAGQAALARLEAKKNDKPRFNTSYAAIQARVKRELELERKAQQNLEQMGNTVLKEKKNAIEDPSIFAVTDVFFRCPYLSEEIMSRDKWKKKIREFLYEQLQGEEAGLTACLIIQNCNTGKEKIENCVETLGKYLDNIINNPDIEKYWKIRMCNKIFQEKVLPVDGALDFLKAAGFEQKKLLHNENEEDFLVWSPDNCNIENLTVLDEALKSAEVIPIELDRNLQVLMPSQARVRNELPSSFFAISAEELKKEQKLRMEAVERNQMLRTKAMREKDEQRVLRRYRFAVLRIKFPDEIILQGTFSVHEKVQNVIEFVDENLVDHEASFLLVTPDGIKLTEDCYSKTLLELRMIPTAVLEFSWNISDKRNSNMPIGYLKEEILSYIQEI